MLNQEQLIEYLKLFKFLNVQDIAKLTKLARYRKLKAGEFFVELDSDKRKVAYIQKGIMRAYYMRADGEERTILFRWEKQVIGSVETILEQKPSRQVIQALEDCKIWEIDYELLQDFIERHPKFERARKYFLQKLLLEALRRVEVFVVKTPEERYEQMLVETPEIAKRVQSKHQASYLGITPVSLSRIRKRLADKRVL